MTLDHVTATRNVIGIRIAFQGTAPTSTSVTARENTGAPLSVHANALVALPKQVVVERNSRDWINVEWERLYRTKLASGLFVAVTG